MRGQQGIGIPDSLRSTFAGLLDGFSTLAARDRSVAGANPSGFRSLLDRFLELRERVDAAEQAQVADVRKRMYPLLDGYGEAVERYR
jgi:hypothetical protein